MFIYNTTVNVDESINIEWLKWMHEIQIPAILATQKFIKVKLCEVLITEDLGGITYAVQYTAKNKEDLTDFITNHAYKFKEEEMKLFSGKYGTFTTELKVISEFQSQSDS